MNPEASLYTRIGGEKSLRKFVNALYSYMDRTPEVAPIKALHTSGFAHASDRLFMFLSGMIGGSPLYMEAFGHPRLRQKHLHIRIGDDERDQWMMCARYAAEQLAIEPAVRDELIATLAAMADHLRNDGDTASRLGNDCRQAVGR